MLRTNLLPTSYVPPKEVRELRKIVRFRRKLIEERTKWKNKIHAELLRYSSYQKNLFNKEGKEFLKNLENPFIESSLLIIESLEKEIKFYDKKIKELANSLEDAEILLTIRICYYSALLILSEIGEIERFSHWKKLCSYFGLVPSTYQSGFKIKHGNITKLGSPYLRWILTEVTQIHVNRYQTSLTKFYKRLEKKRGRNKAIVATARKLLAIIYCILKNKEPFKG